MKLTSFVLIAFVLLSCDNTNNDQELERLKAEVKALEEQLSDSKVSEPDKTEPKPSVETQTKSKSNIILPDASVLDGNYKVKAEILSAREYSDQNFNKFIKARVKNNYNKTIISLRIGSNQWVQRGYQKVRTTTEKVSVTIRPGETKEITLRNQKFGILFKPLFEVDAVVFSDNTSDASTPPTSS